MPVIVLDPLRDPGWKADFITSDPATFLDIFWKSRCCAAFIDEAGETVGRFDDAMHTTATRGRHLGHNVHFIAQRAQMISPNVRSNCTKLALFSVSRTDAKLLAQEWNRPEFENAPELKRGEFFYTNRFGDCSLNRVF